MTTIRRAPAGLRGWKAANYPRASYGNTLIVEGWVHAHVPGLGVHREGRRDWWLTHIGSGLHIVKAKTLKAVAELALQLKDTADWTLPAEAYIVPGAFAKPRAVINHFKQVQATGSDDPNGWA